MIEVPEAFRAMPRWRRDPEGAAWLDRLPLLVQRRCAAWGLEVDGAVLHGSNALIVPVRREDEPCVLRLAPPGDDVAAEVRALRTWDGRGVVRLLDVDEPARSTLLERLDARRSLLEQPLADAVEVLAGLTRELAVPVPVDVRSTTEEARDALDGFERDWRRLGRPMPRRLLAAALDAAAVLASTPAARAAVDGDLHFAQVLAADRAPWLVVDPVLLRGDPEYDLGRVLWSRLDEAGDDAVVRDLFERFVRTAGVPADRARRWVVVRATSYLLWGLDRGLTEDPPRCRRLLDLFA